jgi:hypothetical protein
MIGDRPDFDAAAWRAVRADRQHRCRPMTLYGGLVLVELLILFLQPVVSVQAEPSTSLVASSSFPQPWDAIRLEFPASRVPRTVIRISICLSGNSPPGRNLLGQCRFRLFHRSGSVTHAELVVFQPGLEIGDKYVDKILLVLVELASFPRHVANHLDGNVSPYAVPPWQAVPRYGPLPLCLQPSGCGLETDASASSV